jgi:hypothetical protein
MKTMRLLAAGLLLAAITPAHSHELPPGTLFGVKVMDIRLVKGRSLDEFIAFYQSTVVPEYERRFVGLRIQVLKSARGPNENALAALFIFESAEQRDRYFGDDGKTTALGDAALRGVQPVRQRMIAEYGSWTGNELDDWIVLDPLSGPVQSK